MSLRVLFVEDNKEIYKYYIRIFEHKLDIEQFEFVHVNTIQASLKLIHEPWDVILMDYVLGPSTCVDQVNLRNGSDLITYRRIQEDMNAILDRTVILGISSSTVGNNMLLRKGANCVFLKMEVVKIADYLIDIYTVKTGITANG